MTFRAPPPGVLRQVSLDAMTAIYDRRSGQTHVVAGVVPTILSALGDTAIDLATVAERLGIAVDGDLVARIDELVAAGLIEAQ